MSDAERVLVLGNMARLLFIVLPIASGLFVVREALQEGLSYGAVGMIALVYATAFLPAGVGGLAHSLLLVKLGRSIRVTRLLGAITSPLVLVGVIMVVDPAFLRVQWAPIMAAMLLYVVVIRVPVS